MQSVQYFQATSESIEAISAYVHGFDLQSICDIALRPEFVSSQCDIALASIREEGPKTRMW